MLKVASLFLVVINAESFINLQLSDKKALWDDLRNKAKQWRIEKLTSATTSVERQMLTD
jgi:hypothetical protein